MGIAQNMSEFATLDAIGLKHGTDKASFFHDYLNFYEIFFSPFRHKEIKILEIGVFQGASLKTWEEYFPKSQVIGADISPSAKKFEKNRVRIELLDQSNIEELTSAAIKHGPFDIIVEDGSHMWEHQTTTLRTLFPFLKDHGIYIVEDLHTNYGNLQDAYRGVATATCMDYLKKWLDLRVADDQLPIGAVEDAFLRTYGRAIQFITFYRRACLIKKQLVLSIRSKGAGQPLVATDAGNALVPVRIVAHISHLGDITGPLGFVNLESDMLTFQGLSIDTAEKLLEYRVRGQDGAWGPWLQNDIFAGTRGQSKTLTGFTIRLTDDARSGHDLRTFARFAGSGDVLEAADGQDCISPTGHALRAIQLVLTRRTG